MDFDAKLSSPSVRDQSVAAMFLHAKGAEGGRHLPALLQKCQAIHPAKDLDRDEEALLGLGAIAMGGVIAETGFDHNDPLHASILSWIVQSTKSPNISVAAHSIYALEKLGSRSSAAREFLCDVVTSERRSDEHEHVSLRAIALRLLRRLDSERAARFADAPALDEYAHAVEYWISTDASGAPETQLELNEEREWLAKIKSRRTTG